MAELEEGMHLLQRLPAEVPLGFERHSRLSCGVITRCGVSLRTSINCRMFRRTTCLLFVLLICIVPLHCAVSYELFECFLLHCLAIIRMSRFEPPELGTHLQGKVVVLTGT